MGTYQARVGKDLPEKWCVRYNVFLQRFEVLNKIGVHSARICSVGTEYPQKMALADAHDLREPPAPDGERLRDAKDHPQFPCHAVRPYLHHKLQEGNTVDENCRTDPRKEDSDFSIMGSWLGTMFSVSMDLGVRVVYLLSSIISSRQHVLIHRQAEGAGRTGLEAQSKVTNLN